MAICRWYVDDVVAMCWRYCDDVFVNDMLWRYVVAILLRYCGDTAVILHCGDMLWQHCCEVVVICCGNSVILWRYVFVRKRLCRDIVSRFWWCCSDMVAMCWRCCGDIMAICW